MSKAWVGVALSFIPSLVWIDADLDSFYVTSVINCWCVCAGEVDYKEIGDCVHTTGFSSTDLCLPALDYLRKCSQVGCFYFEVFSLLGGTASLMEVTSQLLAKIYKMPSKPVFLGARLASLPMRSQERSVSSEDGVDGVLQEFDDDTGEEKLLF